MSFLKSKDTGKNKRDLNETITFQFSHRDDRINGFYMYLYFPSFYTLSFTRENKQLLEKLLHYTSFKFYMKELTDGCGLLKSIQTKGYPYNPRNYRILEYNGKSAMINASYYSKKLEIRPFMKIDAVDISGLTVTPGNFSDLDIFEQMCKPNLLAGTTKDFREYTGALAALFLDDYMEYVKNFIRGKIPEDLDETICKMPYLNKDYNAAINEIIQYAESKIHINQKKRIDSLVVNDKTVRDWMKEYDICYKYFISDTDVLRVSIAMGKPLEQVKKYMEKVIDSI